MGTRKRTTFSTSHPIASPKRSLFFVSHRKTYPEHDHFSGNTVGAYCIRPTKRHPMDSECLYTTKGRALAPLRRVVCGAYAIRPYTGTRKRATFSTSHPIASPKGSLFFVSHLITYPERGAFFTCYNRETIQRAAFYVFHRMTCPDMCCVRIYRNRGTIEKRCVSRIPRHGMISTRCGWGMRRRGTGRGGKISCLVTSEKS